MAHREETLESFAEDVRKILGRSLADLGLGARERAIQAIGQLATRAEKIVHSKAMEAEQEDPDRFALAGLAKMVDLRSAAPERDEE